MAILRPGEANPYDVRLRDGSLGGTADGVLNAAGDSATSLIGALLGAVLFTSAGDSTTSLIGAALVVGRLATAGDATAALKGAALDIGTLAGAGDSTASLKGAALDIGGLASSGASTAAIVGAELAAGALASTGTSGALFTADDLAVGQLVAAGASTLALVGAALAVGKANSAGDSSAAFASSFAAAQSPTTSTSGGSRRPSRSKARAPAPVVPPRKSRRQIFPFVRHVRLAGRLTARGESSAAFAATRSLRLDARVALGTLTARGDSESALRASRSLRTGANVSSVGDSSVSFSSRAIAVGAIDGSGDTSASMHGAACTNADLRADGDSTAAFGVVLRSSGAFQVEGIAGVAVSATVRARGDSHARGDAAVALAAGARACAEWASQGDSSVTLSPGARQTSGFAAIGVSDVKINGQSDWNLEAVTRRVFEEHGVELVPRMPTLEARADAAAHLTRPAERTAAFVVAQRHLGHAVTRRRVPIARPPTLIESDYAASLVKLVDAWRSAIDPLLAEIPKLLASAREQRGDAEDLARVQRAGLDIVIENSAGSRREWVDSDGTTGSTLMRYAYGYIDGVRGADGEEVDVYLGPVERPAWVYVIHQQRKSTDFVEYDEDKVMLGWDSADAAVSAYLAQYSDPRFFGGLSQFTLDDFKAKLVEADLGKITHEQRADVGENRRARSMLDAAQHEATTATRTVERVARQAAELGAEHHKGELARQTTAGLGVAVPVLDRKLPTTIEHFVHENVALMKSLAANTLGDIEKLVMGAFARGVRSEDLGAEIERRFGIAERHARLIARDQLSKLNAQVTRMRHEEIGVAKFRWVDAGDARVRDWHHANANKIWPYRGEGAPSFFPGDEILCRCGELPVFDDILSLVDDLIAA